MDILKKILICIYNLQGGGAERVLINFLNLIDEKKFKVTLLVLKKEGVYLDKVPSHIKVIYGFKTLFGRKISNKVLKFFDGKILHKIFIKEKFDVEIAFLEGYATKLIRWNDYIITRKNIIINIFLKRYKFYIFT